MTEAASKLAPESMRLGVFHYMQPSAEPSLYRNGKVLTRRDRDGSDSGRLGVDLEEREMAIIRCPAASLRPGNRHWTPTGSSWCERPMADPDLDFLDHDAVVRAYYPECAETVREATGRVTSSRPSITMSAPPPASPASSASPAASRCRDRPIWCMATTR